MSAPKKTTRKAATKRTPRGGLAVANTRRSPPDALDFFPTPPWATRALCEVVLPEFGLGLENATVWEPACGEGHMAHVLEEYAGRVIWSDVHDYGVKGQHVGSFIGEGIDVMATPKIRGARSRGIDWIITNPPFSKADEFVLRALDDAPFVAMLVRSNYGEGQSRYRDIFRDRRPLIEAVFAERVPMHRGEWKPDGDTMTAYSWFVWRRGSKAHTAKFWIPPGQRRALERPTDRRRFTRVTEAPLLTRIEGGG